MKHDNTRHRDFLKISVAGTIALAFLAFVSLIDIGPTAMVLAKVNTREKNKPSHK